MTLRLSVPATDPSASATPEVRPKQVQAWVETLPLTQVFESTRSINRALTELNRSRLSDEDRLRLIEIYYPSIKTLLEELGHEFTGASLPLPAKAREAAALAREMLIETSYAYKLALLDKSVKGGLFSAKRSSAALPIGRAIFILSEILTTSYRSYNPTPAGVWYEIHQLYRHASQEGLLDTPPDSNSDTPHLVYKKALLLALADPYHLVHDAQDSVQRVVHDNATHLVLQNYVPDAAMPGLFSVNSLSDMPPRPVALQQAERDRTHDLVLQTFGLVQRIDQLAAQADLATRSGVVRPRDSGHLRRLSQLWSAPPKRIFRRSATQASVQICFGLKATHYFVGAETKVRDALPASNESLLDTMKMAALQLSSSWETFTFYECDLINQSAGGLKLRRDGTNTPDLGVGEIVGVRQSSFGGQSLGVSVGSVRWVQSDDDDESMEFGIQMLAPKADAVSLASAIDIHGKTQGAMLLPAIPALQQSESLVTPPGMYAEAGEFTINDGKRSRRVRATKLQQQTLRFELFEFVDV